MGGDMAVIFITYFHYQKLEILAFLRGNVWSIAKLNGFRAFLFICICTYILNAHMCILNLYMPLKIVEKFVLLELVFYSMYSVLLNIFSRNRGIYFLHSCLNSFLCSEGIRSSRLAVRLRWLYVNVQNIDLP